MALANIVAALRKAPRGHVVVDLELRQRSSSGAETSQVATGPVLSAIWAHSPDAREYFDGLEAAVAALNTTLAMHNYDGWALDRSGHATCRYSDAAAAVLVVNSRLDALRDRIGLAQSMLPRGLSGRQLRGYAGWVTKQGGFVKNWKRRFMIFRHGLLYYYLSDEWTASTKPKGSFDVVSVTYALDRRHGIDVHGRSKRVFRFNAMDAAGCAAWHDTLAAFVGAAVLPTDPRAEPQHKLRRESNQVRSSESVDLDLLLGTTMDNQEGRTASTQDDDWSDTDSYLSVSYNSMSNISFAVGDKASDAAYQGGWL